MELEQLNGHWDGVTVNVGAISGGGPTNIVPDSAVVRLNVRVPTGQVLMSSSRRLSQ